MKFTLFAYSLLLRHAAGSDSKGSIPHATIEFGRTSFRRRVDTSPYPIHRVKAPSRPSTHRELKTVKKRITHVFPKAGKRTIALTNVDGGVDFGTDSFSFSMGLGSVRGVAANGGIVDMNFGEVSVGGKTEKSGKTGKRDFSLRMDSADVPGEAADGGTDFGEVEGKTGKRDFSLSMDFGVGSLKVMEFGKVGEEPINGGVEFSTIEVVGGKAAKRNVVFSMSISMSMSMNMFFPFVSNDNDDVFPIQFDDDTSGTDHGIDDYLDDSTDDTTDDNSTDDNATDDNADGDDVQAPPTPSTPALSVDGFISTPPTRPPAPFDDDDGAVEDTHLASGAIQSGNTNEIAPIPIPNEIRCGSKGAASERFITFTFYYKVESTSGKPDLTNIEGAVVRAVAGEIIDCDNRIGRRSLAARRQQGQDTILVAVESSPHVIADEYACSVGSTSNPCHVVEGKLSLVVTGDDSEKDKVIVARAQEAIALAFESLSVNDHDIVEVTYVGTDPSALVTADRTNNINSAQASTEPKEVSATYTSIFIATAGAVIVLAALMTGLHHMNKKDGATPAYDDKSSDGNSTAHLTAEMTLECPTYDESSICPPHLCTQEIYAKHFVLAEEEESNWRELRVLPSIAPSGAALMRVSEEPSDGGVTAEMSI